MRETLSAYVERLKAADAAVIGYMADGANDSDMSDINGLKLSVPQDVFEFWGMMNGVKAGVETSYDQLWLDGTFRFYSAKEAADDYKVCLPLWDDDEDFKDYWPVGFLSIGSPGDGSRLLVNCRAASPTYGHIYELFHGMGLSLHAKSLTDYFKTQIALFDAGVLTVEDDGALDIDFDKNDAIAAPLNPNCDAYNSDLTPAYDSKNWLAEGETS
ncbi:MAG: SMI1/KNR4 family protein [Maricaulaceae bacterium]